jgi:hypothetical protein
MSNTLGYAGGWASGSIDVFAVTDAEYATGWDLLIRERGQATDSHVNFSYATTYYLLIARDYDGGTGTGSLTVKIYSTSADRDADSGSNLIDTLSVNLTAQTDFQYFYPLSAYTPSGGQAITGVLSNLDLGL